MGGYGGELGGTEQCHCSFLRHWRNFGKLVLAVHRRSVFPPQICPVPLQATLQLPSHPSHKHLACGPPVSATVAALHSGFRMSRVVSGVTGATGSSCRRPDSQPFAQNWNKRPGTLSPALSSQMRIVDQQPHVHASPPSRARPPCEFKTYSTDFRCHSAR